MSKINEVISIRYQREYVYRIVFDDGLEAELDFAEYLDKGPVFSPLRDPDFFRRARVEGGTIAWPNGVDIAPETLYDKAAKVKDLSAGLTRPLK